MTKLGRLGHIDPLGDESGDAVIGFVGRAVQKPGGVQPLEPRVGGGWLSAGVGWFEDREVEPGYEVGEGGELDLDRGPVGSDHGKGPCCGAAAQELGPVGVEVGLDVGWGEVVDPLADEPVGRGFE